MSRRSPVPLLAILGLCCSVAACSGDATDSSTETDPPTATDASDSTDTSTPTSATNDTSDRFPDVIGAVATFDDGTDSWSFEVTISSPYDSPARYADGWRVVGPDGSVYGVHTLAHDHAAEQPFTRRQVGVAIPEGVGEVTIEGRDQTNGFGGRTLTIPVQTG